MSMNESNLQDLEDYYSEPTHEQLPSVEEVKMTVGGTGVGKSPNKRTLLLGLAGAILLIMAITIPVASKKGNKNPNYSNTLATSPKKNITEIVYGFALNGEADFQDTTSYQYRAMRQLVEDPMVENYEDYDLKQRYAMYCLHHATTPNNWVESSGWKRKGVPECDWFGVTCQLGTNTVTRIGLRNNGLQGEIPPEMILMTSEFRVFNVNANDLSGTVPSAFCHLASHHGWDVKVDCEAVECGCCTNCD